MALSITNCRSWQGGRAACGSRADGPFSAPWASGQGCHRVDAQMMHPLLIAMCAPHLHRHRVVQLLLVLLVTRRPSFCIHSILRKAHLLPPVRDGPARPLLLHCVAAATVVTATAQLLAAAGRSSRLHRVPCAAAAVPRRRASRIAAVAQRASCAAAAPTHSRHACHWLAAGPTTEGPAAMRQLQLLHGTVRVCLAQAQQLAAQAQPCAHAVDMRAWQTCGQGGAPQPIRLCNARL